MFKNKTEQNRNDEKYNQTGIIFKIHTNHDGVWANILYIKYMSSMLSNHVVFSQLQCVLCQWDLTHFYTEEKAKAVRIIFSCKHTCNLLYTQNKVKFIFGNFERVGWFKWCVICIHLIHVGYFMLLGWKICAISVWWVCMDHTSQHGSWICAWHYSCWFAW